MGELYSEFIHYSIWIYVCLALWLLGQILIFLSEEDLPFGSENMQGKFTIQYSIFSLVLCSIVYFTGHFAINLFKSGCIVEGLIVLVVGIILCYLIVKFHDWKFDKMMYKIRSGDGIVRMAETVAIQTKTKEQFRQVARMFLAEGITWSSGCDLIQEDNWDKHGEKTCIMKELYGDSYVIKCGPEEILEERRTPLIFSFQEFLAVSNDCSVKHL